MGPLHGVRVLHFSTMISGPLATMLLADQGADVIKVESPGLGDLMRYLGSASGGLTGLFIGNNRGKRSLVVDLKQQAEQDAVRRLIGWADVLVQNFRPGAMDRLGFGYSDAAAINPDLIYVSISGFGATGPKSDRRVYDNIVQASSGLASVQTDNDGNPTLFRTLVCDKVTALTAAQAITAALFARERHRSGGQHITLAMLDAAVSFTWPDSAMDITLLDPSTQRRKTIGAGYVATPFADGAVAVSVVSDAEYLGYFRALGHPELCEDERYNSMTARMPRIRELTNMLRGFAAEMSVAEFLRQADRFDVPAAAIVALADVPDDEQVLHNEVFTVREHPIAGRIREPRPAARFDDTVLPLGRHAPGLGEHTEEILAELGLGPAAGRDPDASG